MTNPDRVYWDDVGLTKQGLAEYYIAVWDWIAPHVVDRALSLVRCPEGVSGECFFQKHASSGLDSKRLKLVPEDGDHVIAIDSVDGIVALVQAGVLEIHVRGSSINHLDQCNRIVFDLDPSPEVGWTQVVEATRDVRARLDAMGLQTFLKTTGGKGLHVVVPIENTAWDEVKAFTRSVATTLAADSPGTLCGNGVQEGADRAHLRGLPAQQPRGDRHRRLFDPRPAGRHGFGADRLGRARHPQDTQPIYRGEPAAAARASAPRPMGRHRQSQAAAAGARLKALNFLLACTTSRLQRSLPRAGGGP